jgi:hypothetical protein
VVDRSAAAADASVPHSAGVRHWSSISRLRSFGNGQAIAVTIGLSDPLRAPWIRLDLVAQPEDEVIDGPRQRRIGVSPHQPQQFVTRDDAASALSQVAQNLESRSVSAISASSRQARRRLKSMIVRPSVSRSRRGVIRRSGA